MNPMFVDNLLRAIQGVVGNEPLGLHEPRFEGNELKYLEECIKTTYVSSVGKFVDQFEYELTRTTGAKYAVALVNGTCALHLALKLAGVGLGDEVLVPSLTFSATANAVVHANATPHFVESESITFGIDSEKLRDYLRNNTSRVGCATVNIKSGKIIKAIVPMHVFGHPSNLEEIAKVCEEFSLIMVEDAAESLGSLYQGKHTGTYGLMGVLSFNGNKTITTGGGGAILTDSLDLAKKAKHISSTAKIAHDWKFLHDDIGYNFRMPNINAAIGCAQLEKLPTLLQSKRKLFEKYRDALSNISEVTLIKEPSYARSNYWLQTILLDQSAAIYTQDILISSNKSGLATRPIWEPLHKLPHFANCPRMNVEVAENLSTRIINIPSSSYLV
ncbi:MAG: LegC family aminotransferase [Polynucleobacter sp.]|nr:LegC family aminotransferase [Polynucleobacter sp.]